MKQPIVLESNQNHATITDNGICPTLPASMGMGGGYIPMIVMVRRFSDVRIYETETSPTIEQGSGGGGNNLPMIVMSIDSYNQTTSLEVAEPLRSAEGGDTKPKVLVIKDGAEDSNREEIRRISHRRCERNTPQ